MQHLPRSLSALRHLLHQAAITSIAGTLLVVAGCSNATNTATSSENAKTRVAVIPKTTAHIFWNSVKAGAEKAAQESDAEIVWKAPTKESDRAAQIQLVQQLVADNVKAVVLAPLDSKALLTPVQEATKAGVPVVIIDSALEGKVGEDFASYVATNNRRGGELAGEAMVKALGGKGKLVMMRYMVGSAATQEREEGFLEVIKKSPDIEIISDSQYSGTTSSEAQTKALNMIDLLKQADGVFTPNESSTDGMLQALRKEGLIKKIKFIGFDSSPPLIAALKDGEINALIAQNPTRMGYLGVKNAIAAIKKKKFESEVDTGVYTISSENIDSPEIKELLGSQVK
jgi:ribose transport system substrate-binding protein